MNDKRRTMLKALAGLPLSTGLLAPRLTSGPGIEAWLLATGRAQIAGSTYSAVFQQVRAVISR